MKDETSDAATTLTVDAIRRVLFDSFGDASIRDIGGYAEGPGLPAGDGAVDFVAHKQGFEGAWEVEVHIRNRGDDRLVSLVARGDSGVLRSLAGTRFTTSLRKSRKVAQRALAAVRNASTE